MLALVCTFAFAAAAAVAIGSIVVSMQGRKGQITALLAEYRTLRQDREFLVRITSNEAQATRAFVAPQTRRKRCRAARPGEARPLDVRVTELPSLRVAA